MSEPGTSSQRPGEAFTPYADLRSSTASTTSKLGTLGELRHRLQTASSKSAVKKFIRANDWDASERIRAELWKELCKDNQVAGRHIVYKESVEEASKGRLAKVPILSSKYRYTVRCDHKLNDEGKAALARVLKAIEKNRPDVTEIPILYSLTALLLHYMKEEDAYSCAMHLIERGNHTLMQTDVAVYSSRRTVMLLVKKHTNATYNYIRKLLPSSTTDDEISNVFADWKAWIFRDLPFEHLIRVVDCFLYEGQKVLFRCVLSLMTSYYRARKAQPTLVVNGKNDVKAVAEDISAFCRAPHMTPTKFMKRMFEVRRLKMSTIKAQQADSELWARKNHRDAASTSLTKETSEYNFAKLRTGISGDSTFLNLLLEFEWMSGDMAMALASWIPSRITLQHPRVLFNVHEQGVSFNRLWHRIQDVQTTILIVRTPQGHTFGAYCSKSWNERNSKERQVSRFFGTGETFVFRLSGANGDESVKPHKWEWVGERLKREKPNESTKRSQEMFMAAEHNWLQIGGGSGEALRFEGNLERGRSSHCDTFDNEPLHMGDPHMPFDVAQLLVIGFVEDAGVVLPYEEEEADMENKRV